MILRRTQADSRPSTVRRWRVAAPIIGLTLVLFCLPLLHSRLRISDGLAVREAQRVDGQVILHVDTVGAIQSVNSIELEAAARASFRGIELTRGPYRYALAVDRLSADSHGDTYVAAGGYFFRHDWLEQPLAHLIEFALVAIMVATGLIVLALRPDLPVASALLGGGCMTLLYYWYARRPISPSDFVDPVAFWIGAGVLLASGLNSATQAHFALALSAEQSSWQRPTGFLGLSLRQITRSIYALYAAIAVGGALFASWQSASLIKARLDWTLFGQAGTGVSLLIATLLGWLRYRGMTRSERQPFRLITLGGLVLILMFAIFSALPIFLGVPPLLNSTRSALIVLPYDLLILVSIFRYRIFDIEMVLNRALVYGVMTLFVALIYAALVEGVGALVIAQGGWLDGLRVLAIAAIAMLFQPVRESVQHGINRLMYGDLEDPYAIVSRINGQLQASAAPEETLASLVRTLGQSLKLPSVSISLHDASGERTVATYTGDAPAAAGTSPVAFKLVHQAAHLGELHIVPRADAPFSPAETQLLNDLAQHAGVAVYAAKATLDLRQSRERVIVAREAERLRLRRDLHDGLGPALSGIVLGLDAARRLASRDPVAAQALLGELKTQMQDTVQEIRRLVYDLRPPALDQLGLSAAVRDLAVRLETLGTLHISVTNDLGDTVVPAAVEVAAYRIVQEALNNVLKHAHARRCEVELALSGIEPMTVLMIRVRDDGMGATPEAGQGGVGLNSMYERAHELGGECVVSFTPGQGVNVTATIPLVSRQGQWEI
jgi:signal transduction histidine kinase